MAGTCLEGSEAPDIGSPITQRATTMDKKLLQATIRYALEKACEREGKKQAFVLSGRGHEPRVTLNRSMAALLKQSTLPRVTISGYGANNYYPARVFTSARTSLIRKLAWSPFEVSRDSAVYLVEPVKAGKPASDA